MICWQCKVNIHSHRATSSVLLASCLHYQCLSRTYSYFLAYPMAFIFLRIAAILRIASRVLQALADLIVHDVADIVEMFIIATRILPVSRKSYCIAGSLQVIKLLISVICRTSVASWRSIGALGRTSAVCMYSA